MPEIHAERRAALRASLATAELDALLVTDLINIRYLTGFTGSNAAALIHTGGDAETLFCTDGRYTTQALAEVPDLEHVVERSSARALIRRAADVAARCGVLGFESQHVSVEEYDDFDAVADGVRLRRAPGLVEAQRAVKDASEIDALRMACEVADRALGELVVNGGLRAGRSEREVARELENLMLDHGSGGASFDTIVAAGANSAVPHHRPSRTQLATGDLVKLDFGATVEGYHSDMTRMFVLGEPAKWQRELYELVYRAQRSGCVAASAGTDVAAVDAAARAVIERGGHGGEFAHGLGHGVGLRVHEAPQLSKNGAGTLAAGMAVTVEPGVYLAGRGGVRIEDTVIVRDGAAEILSLSTKELVVV